MQPYYQHNGIALYLGDCLEIMPELPDQSIDAVICDPPYGTTACAWDTVIPFAPMWREIKRLIRPRTPIVLFGQEPFSSLLRVSNLDWYKYDWVWKKNIPTDFLNAKNRPLREHENIIAFSSGTTANGSQNQMIYCPQRKRGKGYRVSSPNDKRTGTIAAGNRKPFKPSISISNGDYYPTSVIDFDMDRHPLHPTQKPLALMRYLVQTYTHPGDTVLDFACGSGTTLRAAKDLGRRAIGIEIREDYAEIAARKLSQEVMELI